MNPSKYNEYNYINFLIATQKTYSCTKPNGCSQNKPLHLPMMPSLDCSLDEISSDELWQEAQKHVSLTSRILVMDDSTLDKFYAKKMEIVTHHCSGFSWASNSYS